MSASPVPSDYSQFCQRFYTGALSEENWRRWYAQRLTTVLQHVTEKSDFYRRHFAGINVTAVSPDDLTTLPFTTKADLRRETYAVLSSPIADASIYYETTGTTGASTPCPRSAKDISWSNTHVEQSWRRLFAKRFGARMPVIGLMGPSELYAFGDTFGDVAQRLGACHAKIWPESSRVGFRKALRLIRELGVQVVVCAPALCLNLAKAAMHYGFDPQRDFDVELFLVLGEICTPEFADNVRSIWGADTLPTLYGSQEALAIATGCTAGRLHLSDPNYLVEILDPDTDRVLGGVGTGELCLTTLIDGSKPLIRYRTGDLVTVGAGECRCGSHGTLIEVIGRIADRITLGEEKYHPAGIESLILHGIRGCLGYQLIIDCGPTGADEVTVLLDLVPGLSGDVAEISARITEQMRRRCGVGTNIAVTAELDPITNTGAFVSWKAARIKDNRTIPDREVEVAKRVASQHAYTS
jgi:phenylacetate-CoA ligase